MRLLQISIVLSLAHFGCNSSSRSAESDPSRSLGGVVYLSPEQPARALGTGPLYLTDVMIDGHAGEIFTAGDAACKDKDPTGSLFFWNVSESKPADVQSHHGMRLLVAAGKTLCFSSLLGQTKLVWAGWKP